jgi:hypothetical protein
MPAVLRFAKACAAIGTACCLSLVYVTTSQAMMIWQTSSTTT